MNHQQAGALGGLTAWANNPERMLEISKRGRCAFLSRFRNDSEKRLYFRRLGMRPKRRGRQHETHKV